MWKFFKLIFEVTSEMFLKVVGVSWCLVSKSVFPQFPTYEAPKGNTADLKTSDGERHLHIETMFRQGLGSFLNQVKSVQGKNIFTPLNWKMTEKLSSGSFGEFPSKVF